MPLDYVLVSDLTPASGVCKIKVRILRLWGFFKKDKPGELSAIDLLLLDEKGDRIQASIKPGLMEKFKSAVQEDSCISVMNFELGPNVGEYRSCNHPYKINFIFYTCVKPCENLSNAEKRYNFCPFTEILAKTNDVSVFVDIIGEIVGMNELKDVTTGNVTTKLLNLQLRDLGDSIIDVALWGNIGVTVYSEVKDQKNGPVVLLGSLMKTMIYKGHGTVQSSKFSTKVYINPSQPEVIKFQEVLCRGDPESCLAITPVNSSMSFHISKNSFAISDLKTISDLRFLDPETSCNILAMIVCLETVNSWYFTGCSICFKTVTPYFNSATEEVKPDKYSCSKCDKQVTTTQTRFKLKFQAMDDTGTTLFIAFDDVVIPLIKKSAYQLLEEQIQFNRSGQTPPELLDLTGCKFVFKIMVGNSGKYSQSAPHRVVSLTKDPDVLLNFSECATSQSGGQLELVTLSATTDGTSFQKSAEPESISVSGSSVATANQTSVVSSEVVVTDKTVEDVNTPTPTSKRTLRHARDDVVQQSATKPKLMYSVKKERK